MERQISQDHSRLSALLDLGHRARCAEELVELDFLAVNGTHAIAPYRQAALWFEDRGICALSGVVQIEANAPYVHWLAHLAAFLNHSVPTRLSAADAPVALSAEWAQWLPPFALWLPIAADAGGVPAHGGLLLARDIPWLDDELPLLAEWTDMLHHAWKARRVPQRLSALALRTRWRRRLEHERAALLPWWRKRKPQLALAACLALCIPIRLTVLSQGALVPANPIVIRSPLDGVIAQVDVAPNQVVKAGTALFRFDAAQLENRDLIAAQALTTAESEYRQALQQALADGKSKSTLATLQGKIEERRAEADFTHGERVRAVVVAPGDGVAMIDDPTDLVGRPVAVGERIMRIAAPGDVEVEAWLPIGDAIPLEFGAPVKLYLSSSPLDPVVAKVRYVSFEPVLRPDGSHAYRVRARIDSPTAHRVGLLGTAKLSGNWAPMAYWILRRPMAAVRQALGW